MAKDQKGVAAGRPITVPLGVSSAAVDLELKDHGQVMIGESEVGGVVRFARENDEFRYLLVDQPNSFLDYLKVTLIFPRAVDYAKTRASAILINAPQDATWSANWTNDTTLEYEAHNLGSVATLTLVIELPKGTILPSIYQRLFGSIGGWPQLAWLTLALILPLVTLFILYLVLSPKIRFNLSDKQDLTERQTPPSSLPPAVAAAIVTSRVSTRAIAATLIDLAARGLFDILSENGEFTFHKKRNITEPSASTNLNPFEQKLLGKIFSDSPRATAEDVRVRIGNSLFSREIAEVYLGIYDEVTKKGLFVTNPSIIQGSYRLVGLVLFFVGIAGFGIGAAFYSDPPTPLLFWIGMIVSALVVIALAPQMPAYTPTGLKTRTEWLKFRSYLENARDASFTAETQEQFVAYLPYAVAMGVEVAWVKKFLTAPFHLPDWYTSANDLVRLEDFSNDLFPIVGYLSKELAAAREPTLS